jgi:hypothetical protein
MVVDTLIASGVPLKVRPRDELVTHTIAGSTRKVCVPVTFTPFASARACSARCTFCSETMVHKDATALSAAIRPKSGYFDGLTEALAELDGLPVGISLSGLESTDDADWLGNVLDIIQAHGNKREGNLGDKILYTNGNGICVHGHPLLKRLALFGLTRLEMSRHHHTGERNQNIMRFKAGMPALDQPTWQHAVLSARGYLRVRLVCIVQKGGVDSALEVADYLSWAHSELGVTDIVLREFSDPRDLYRDNATLRHIRHDRVTVDSLLEALVAGPNAGDFKPVQVERGYYYWNVTMRWRGKVDVTFEASDYGAMKDRHASDTVHKLIYHANGNLCGDWDPNTCVLMRTSAAAGQAPARGCGGAKVLPILPSESTA